jgi:hypothetical protein
VQRSGYPDLRIVERASRRVFYLDQKLYAAGSRDSSSRTFYFEPKKATNKVRDDAVHFIVGFEHERWEKKGGWKFTRWDLVDLSHFKVKLKLSFKAATTTCTGRKQLWRRARNNLLTLVMVLLLNLPNTTMSKSKTTSKSCSLGRWT